VRYHLLEKHADVDVIGENYPPPPVGAAIASAVGLLWMLGMAFALLGDKIFGLLGLRNLLGEEMIGKIVEKKFMILAGLFILNSWSQSLVATGAFEVYFEGDLIHSKLETGVVPTVEDLIATVATLKQGLVAAAAQQTLPAMAAVL
jgi:thioredoxin reductase-like selenoprotein T|tara:strand:+ start:1110 stop:1547 length:438 start_codon:yes stop_codon:yes gene_type:complete